MLIRKKISDYLVFETESILKALSKINENKKRIVFVVSEDGRLCGSFTDGDFRRWITATDGFDLTQPVSSVMYESVAFRKVTDTNTQIETEFSHAIDIVPLVDDYQRLVAIAFRREKGITVGSFLIDDNSPCFIIAEIGNNHNGDIGLAKHLVDLAVESGANCVKFQMRDLNSLYKSGNDKDVSADLGAQYTMDLLGKFQLSNKEMIEVFDYVKTKELTPLCTPWDLRSLEVLEDYGMEAYKVASADFTNLELLSELANTAKPLICSTGMSTEAEIKASSEFLRSRGVQYVVLHCNSTYPTPFKDVNLAYLPRLKKICSTVVGYSGHERGFSVPIAAVTLGAKVIEKHFTIDKELEGNDHKVSLLPHEFKSMVVQIRQVEEAIGEEVARKVTQGEMINREALAKSLIASSVIEKGQVITRELVEVKSPGQGLQPIYLDKLLGRRALKSFKPGDFFYESDLKDESVSARSYSFNRPFGIPVRYHDYTVLAAKSNLDFVEFHLSYQDIELDIDNFFDGSQEINFAVHSPELFSGDHIMDLASANTEYRVRSINELSRVCEITRSLKHYFPKTDRPIVVINAGGATGDGFVESDKKLAMYELIAKSLYEVNQNGIEIVIQTMPPFPWHFGGQRYHNLFVNAKEIVDFCSKYGYRICYDVSHSMMSCNYYNWDLSDFTKKVGPFAAHIHIVDALGIDGEGVEIGKGDVNFDELVRDLNSFAPGIQFIPEVWQGHKNDGEGFWKALEFLEGSFACV